MKSFLTILLLFFSFNVFSEAKCILTTEYKKARHEAYSYTKGFKTPEYKCRESVQKANYWNAITNCEKVNGGECIGGGCYHTVPYGSYSEKIINDKHCDILKIENPDKAYKEWLSLLVKDRKIKKCAQNKDP